MTGIASRFQINNSANVLLSRGVIRQQTYLKAIADGKAVGIDGLCITPEEVSVRMGSFGTYCPVR